VRSGGKLSPDVVQYLLMVAERITTPTPPVGVIESLSQGFETTASRLGLLVLPLLLDLFLWLGPRVSYLHYYRDIWAPRVIESGQEMPGFGTELSSAVEEVVAQLPAAQYLPIIGLPSLLAAQEAGSPPLGYTPPVWTVQSTAGLLATYALALSAGAVLGCLYLMLIGQQVGEGQVKLVRAVLQLPAVLCQVAVLLLIEGVLAAVVMTPFVLLAMGLGLFAGWPLMDVTLRIGLVIVLWLSMFSVFTLHGLLMNRRGLFGALWDSVRVVQWNMSSTLFLIIIVVILNWALQQLFLLSDTSTWVTLAAIPAHAFAITALVTATFVFYKDRYRYWKELRDELLAELERRRAQDRTQT